MVVLHCDHVHPVSDGGSDDPSNLVTSCQDCNLGKSNVPLCQIVKPLAAIKAEIRERRKQVAEYNRLLLAIREEDQRVIDHIGGYWYNQFCDEMDKDKYVFAGDRITSIRAFLKRLPHAEILDAIDLAHSRKQAAWGSDNSCWKYFCGVCWTKIREAESR